MFFEKEEKRIRVLKILKEAVNFLFWFVFIVWSKLNYKYSWIFLDLSRRDSLDDGDHPHQSEFVVLKERKLVQIKQLRAGIQRFSIMMEMCGPGSVPDANFISAAFDLVYIKKLYDNLYRF